MGLTPQLLTRPSVPALDAMLGFAHPVLDHGFVRLIDYMGDEAAVVQAARVSYGAGTKQTSEDRGLIRYLMRHRHSTPFEMAEIKLHCKLPIFVARQWIRHRTANVNEYSARYSILDREFYIPKAEDIKPQAVDNKQGRAGEFSREDALDMQRIMQQSAESSFDDYDVLVKDDGGVPGVARELSRIVLPASTYTQWYWKVDLHNLLHFLSLRADPHAQKEIRVYADQILRIVQFWMPNVYDAFMDYRMQARTFSGQEMAILRRALANNPAAMAFIDRAADQNLELTKRERSAFLSDLRGADVHA